MKLSFEWLSEFVDLSGLGPQDVADKLTMGAFEVEEITSFGPDIRGTVIVGEIVEINPHPNADKIRLTKIKFDETSEPKEIVCGAWNIEPGHRIPVALPGAKVINRHDGSALDIKESKIRGVQSNGMLCSAPELGISGSGEGILILDKSTPLGLDIKELLQLKQDWILHVEPRSNRGDALSVVGMAREVAALLGRPRLTPQWIEEFALLQKQAENIALEVSIANQEDCPFFSARPVSGVKIGPSQSQITRRLEAIGQRSINNVVDITNYVLQELGQPLHAYDLQTLNGQCLEVRRAHPGEKLVTIDGKERELNEEVLVIADKSQPVGIAGVMGGKLTEVSDSSQDLVLEAAAFQASRVRKSSRHLGLSSDSSLRFERSVDKASVRHALDRASYLLLKFCGGKLGAVKTAGSDLAETKTVQLRLSELKRIGEIEIVADIVVELLEPLGFTCHLNAEDYEAGRVNIDIPSFRQKDVSREIDLIEEVCRLWGYDRIPVSMPKETMSALPADNLSSKIRSCLSACGLNEVWTSSLTSFDDLSARKVLRQEPEDVIAVLNPLSAEHQVLRQSLLPGLMKVASYNQDRGWQEPWLFELGRAYFHDASIQQENTDNQRKQTPTREDLTISAFICGEPKLSSWLNTSPAKHKEAISFFTIKGIVENLCQRLGIPTEELSFETEENTSGWFHPGRSCRITVPAKKQKKEKSNNKNGSSNQASKTVSGNQIVLGWIGELHPAVVDSYKVKGQPCAFELSCNALRLASQTRNLQEVYPTPKVMRDLTVDLDSSVMHGAVESLINSLAKGKLQQTELVSVFCPSDSQRSLTYRLTFQDPQETLTGEAVDVLINKIREELKTQLSASFRA